MELTQLRYTAQEAAAILRIHLNTLHRRIHEGRIRAMREGAKYFIHRDEIERYAKGDALPAEPRRLRRAG